jgi:hypothetical protein
MKTQPQYISRPANGFTRTDAVALLGGVAALLLWLLPVISQSAITSSSLVCRNNLGRLALASLLYAHDNSQYLPWAPLNHTEGLSSSQSLVFAPGGPGTNVTNGVKDPAGWLPPSTDAVRIQPAYGGVFWYVTGATTATYEATPGSYPEASHYFRCPDSGTIGSYLKVNYSINRWTNPGFGKVGARGASLNAVPNPSEKVLLAQLAPWVMPDAGFTPGLANAANIMFQMHDIGIPFAFMDGHVEGVTAAKAWRMTTNETDRYFHPMRR